MNLMRAQLKCVFSYITYVKWYPRFNLSGTTWLTKLGSPYIMYNRIQCITALLWILNVTDSSGKWFKFSLHELVQLLFIWNKQLFCIHNVNSNNLASVHYGESQLRDNGIHWICVPDCPFIQRYLLWWRFLFLLHSRCNQSWHQVEWEYLAQWPGQLLELTHINGLEQERCNFIANTLELHLSCTMPSIGGYRVKRYIQKLSILHVYRSQTWSLLCWQMSHHQMLLKQSMSHCHYVTFSLCHKYHRQERQWDT